MDKLFSMKKSKCFFKKIQIRFEGLLSVAFTIGKHNCSLIQSGESYELRIDSMVFNHLLELEKSKSLFGKNSEPVSNHYRPNFEISNKNQKPSFGIGNIGSKPTNKEEAKPIFNFQIKQNNEGQNNNFNKFGGKFVKLEDKQKDVPKFIPNKNNHIEQLKNQQEIIQYEPNKEEGYEGQVINDNQEGGFFDPFSGGDDNQIYDGQGQGQVQANSNNTNSNDLNDIFGFGGSGNENVVQNNQNHNQNQGDFMFGGNQQFQQQQGQGQQESNNFNDFTFKNFQEQQGQQQGQGQNSAETRKKLIDNIILGKVNYSEYANSGNTNIPEKYNNSYILNQNQQPQLNNQFNYNYNNNNNVYMQNQSYSQNLNQNQSQNYSNFNNPNLNNMSNMYAPAYDPSPKNSGDLGFFDTIKPSNANTNMNFNVNSYGAQGYQGMQGNFENNYNYNQKIQVNTENQGNNYNFNANSSANTNTNTQNANILDEFF